MPDKIMKTLTIGDTTYTINDSRVDSLQDDFTDLGLTVVNGIICITFEEVAV